MGRRALIERPRSRKLRIDVRGVEGTRLGWAVDIAPRA